jgi:beta-N-acetylhexosaminidase
MEGARRLDGRNVSYAQAAGAALNAGCDMVLLCNQSVDGGAAVDELIEGLDRAVAAGEVGLNAVSDARRLALLPKTPPLPWDELMRDASYRRALDRLP